LSLSIHLRTDTITPDMRRRLRRVANPGLALRGAGLVILAMGKDAFTNPSIRPSAWDPLKPDTLAKKAKLGYGSSPLIASGTLAHSPRIIEASRKYVLVGSDRKAGAWSLAGIHQLGAPRAGIPARPFFPFGATGEATDLAKARVREVIVRWLARP
jgi:phage gpG-like protein